jgi:Protein of unknown function (DUF2726)
MNSSAIAAALGVVLLLLVWLWLRGRRTEAGSADAGDRLDTLTAWPPKVTRILTSQERLAHNTLLRAFPDHLILAQVPLSRFLRVPTRYSHAEWLRRVGQLCVDLVVCDTATQPLAVIIVEPPGGAPSERARVRHDRMLRVLKAAEVRCFVWVENAFPSVEIARASVLELSPEPAPGGAPAAQPAAVVAEVAGAQASVVIGAPGAFDDTERDSTHAGALDEGEPPPTWYDDINSGPTPLHTPKPPEPGKR